MVLTVRSDCWGIFFSCALSKMTILHFCHCKQKLNHVYVPSFLNCSPEKHLHSSDHFKCIPNLIFLPHPNYNLSHSGLFYPLWWWAVVTPGQLNLYRHFLYWPSVSKFMEDSHRKDPSAPLYKHLGKGHVNDLLIPTGIQTNWTCRSVVSCVNRVLT